MSQAPARSYVAWLGEASGGSDLLGGKGASLDRLARLGFAVPAGFCLTTSAFHAQLEALPGPGARRPPDELEMAVASTPVEPAVLAELRDGLARLERASREPGWKVRLAV